MNGLAYLHRRQWLRKLVAGAICGAVSTSLLPIAKGDDGPNSSLFSGQLPPMPGGATGRPAPTGWYEVPLPPPKEIKVHDIVTIRVDVGSRVTSDAEYQRRRNTRYDAILNDFITLKGLRAIKPAPQSDGDQRVQGNVNQQDRAQGELETTETLKFDIGAEVAAILPNGNLVLEAHREVRNNHEVWMHSLTGVCRREDIGPGNLVLGKDMANLHIEKNEVGQVRDSYKRGWLARWWDEVTPF